MECPSCGSHLYERTPLGKCCVACKYSEALEDKEVLVERPPRNAHGYVYNDFGTPSPNSYVSPRNGKRPLGTIREFRDIRRRSEPAALAYLQERQFAKEDELNRQYLAAKLCLELGKLNPAKEHIEKCCEKLDQAKHSEQVLELRRRIDEARAEVLSNPFRSRKLR